MEAIIFSGKRQGSSGYTLCALFAATGTNGQNGGASLPECFVHFGEMILVVRFDFHHSFKVKAIFNVTGSLYQNAMGAGVQLLVHSSSVPQPGGQLQRLAYCP